MLVTADKSIDFSVPSSALSPGKKDATVRGFHSPVLDDDFDIFNNRMSGTGASSPFIKDEPDEWNFANNGIMSTNQNPSFTAANSNSNSNSNMNMNNNYNNAGVNPSDISGQNGGEFNDFNFNQQSNNMTGSFNMGNSHFRDDELLDLDLNESSHNQNQVSHHGAGHDHEDMHGMFGNQNQQMSNQQMFSGHTPSGEPMQSPFNNPAMQYAYQQQMAQQQQQQHQVQQPQHSAMSPSMRPPIHGDFNFAGGRNRHSLGAMMDRKPSDSRSPMTPKTPALGGLNLGGTPDSGSVPSQPIHAGSLPGHRHNKSLDQWGSNPASLQSNEMYSPMGSPMGAPSHAIAEVMKGSKGASLPSKMEAPGYQTQEAKRRRRRESHNMVERRRRDNINERIQELSHLVPQHRLEDEKIRKHLANNGPLSPQLAATGISPPQATSLLAGGGRRATGAGNITLGIPIEEKDKGPNKGDILNGSVGWTRDLMWGLNKAYGREEHLKEYVVSLGGTWPFTDNESDKRMRTELNDAMEKNDASTFDYSRGNGSGLRVPKHTGIDGSPMQGHSGSGSGSGMSPQDLNDSGAQWDNGVSFKEEDEYDMQL